MPMHDHGPALRPPRSTCKICWRGLYIHQEAMWVISPNPGLAHQDCVRKQRQALLAQSLLSS